MYDSFIDLNKKFKASVNLEFDLYNEDIIREYIPTTDLCDVIKLYIKSVLNGDEFRSTILAGPYGKGKSYLVLMITYLLSERKNKELFNNVINKIKLIDDELFMLLKQIDEKGIYLYPVIINNNSFENINKTFILALNNMLEYHKITDIVPKTTFQECLDILNKWEKNSTDGFDVKRCLKNYSLEELRLGLKNCDIQAYNEFSNLYTCISKGLEFYSMRSDDIVSIYFDVAKQLTSKYKNCFGLFIVFDEFGSLLNSQTSDFASKLGRIQSLAEKANQSSNKCQMHLCCITHKDLLLYKKDKSYSDAFETISGRFKQIRFDRSLEENYQIICSALIKNKNYKSLNFQLRNKYSSLFKRILTLGLYTEEQYNYVLDNGLPFNPITLYCLIQVSEKIAQNERTLFTFLSDKDVDGFRYFISNNDDTLLNVDSIYNYFNGLIKDNNEYKMLYYKVESLINNSLKKEEHLIFKAIAIIKIINDEIKMPCTIENIACSLSLEISECEKIIYSLVERNILKKNINDDSVDFAIIADDEINKMLNDIAELKYKDVDLSSVISEFNPKKYEFSNKYNFKNHMVRFFKVIYLESSKLLQIISLNDIYLELSKHESFDGLIVNLINDSKISEEQIKFILGNSKENIIIRYIAEPYDKNVIYKFKLFLSANYLLNEKKDLSNSVVKALPILIDDLKDELTDYLYNKYYNSINFCRVDYKEKDLKKCIEISLSHCYPKTIRFNNEQVNKNEVSSVTIKARNNVIDSMLNQIEMFFSPTSQEMTIFNAFQDSEKYDVIEELKKCILSSKGKKTSFNKIAEMLKNEPYGMRNGIIPLFVADVISKNSIISENNVDTVILYNENIELDLNSTNLSKALLNPNKYYFCYTSLNNEKLTMTNKLIKLFSCNVSDIFSVKIKDLVKCMKLYISNTIPMIVKSNQKDNLLGLSNEALCFKDEYLKLNTNNYELLFSITPKIFGCDIEDIAEKIKCVIDEYDIKYNNLLLKVSNKLINVFGYNEGSIKSVIDNWLNEHKYISNIIFDNRFKKIYITLQNLTYGIKDSLNLISFATVNCALEDWNLKKYQLFFEIIKEFVEYIENYKIDDFSLTKEDLNFDLKEEIKLSSLGNTLYSNLCDTIEEYGDAISNEEKVLIFKKILKNLL